jgi:hypothetical protein
MLSLFPTDQNCYCYNHNSSEKALRLLSDFAEAIFNLYTAYSYKNRHQNFSATGIFQKLLAVAGFS